MKKQDELDGRVERKGRHCIIGDDYEEGCETTGCMMLDACRKEHKQRCQNQNGQP